jgi:pyruvate formate lyase activating enzyme
MALAQAAKGERPLGKEALLYRRLPSGKVQCLACSRYCQIGEGQVGLCGIRGVADGKLYLYVYGRVITGQIDPIEKKPVVHYRPGSKIFSVATTGCNWLCAYCQNFDISQRRKVEGIEVEAEELVEMAVRYRCQGLAYTYNEPTIFIEWARDIGLEARKRGLFNIFVTNGYETPEAVGLMKEFLDCATVDFKGSGEPSFVRRYIGIEGPDPIFQTLLEIKNRTSIHLEVTDLIVPEVGDDLDAARRLARWIYDNLGPDTPLHFLRFHPDYRLLHLPYTPIETLEAHYRVAKEAGLNYVYIGNVPGHPAESTYCPGCGAVVVKRRGYYILGWGLDEQNRCRACGHKIPIVGCLEPTAKEFRFLPVLS